MLEPPFTTFLSHHSQLAYSALYNTLEKT